MLTHTVPMGFGTIAVLVAIAMSIRVFSGSFTVDWCIGPILHQVKCERKAHLANRYTHTFFPSDSQFVLMAIR